MLFGGRTLLFELLPKEVRIEATPITREEGGFVARGRWKGMAQSGSEKRCQIFRFLIHALSCREKRQLGHVD